MAWERYSGSTGGGGGTWGTITGTLSAQTDLQTALDGKQPVDSDLTTIAAISPTRGDLIVANSSNVWTRLARGSDGQVLKTSGSDLVWSSSTLTNVNISTTATAQLIDCTTTLTAATGNEIAYLLSYTTNKASSGNDTGLKIAMTDTASPGTSLLIDCHVGGSSKFAVGHTGKIWSGVTPATSNYVMYCDGTTNWVNAPNGGDVHLGVNENWGMSVYVDTVRMGQNYVWGFTAAGPHNSIDTGLARTAAGVLRVMNGSTGGAALEFVEQTAPSAPAANRVRIYSEDNGAGKTRLMALFPSGAAQQIAIEP